MIHIETVRVADVRPDENNPRAEAAATEWAEQLADSMEADGGVPRVPISVARDGGGFRVVDGECRWRAMVLLGTEECEALVADDADDVEAMLTMLATNMKCPLTGDELARGVQQALLLGLDPVPVAKASRADAAMVAAMKRQLPRIERSAAQWTLLECARLDAFEGDADAVAALVEAKEAGRFDFEWYNLDAERKRTEGRARAEAAAVEAGIEWMDPDEYARLGYSKRLMGPSYDKPYTAKRRCGCDGFRASADAYGKAVFFCVLPGNHVAAEDPAKAAEAEAERAHSRDRRRRDEFVAQLCIEGTEARLTDWMQDVVGPMFADQLEELDTCCGEGGEEVPRGVPDTFFVRCVAAALKRSHGDSVSGLSHNYWCKSQGAYIGMLDALEQCGYAPSDDEEQLRRGCRAVLAEREAEQAAEGPEATEGGGPDAGDGDGA